MSQSPILITGGAQRLGRYCAERLVDDGHPVIISYRREREELDALRALGIRTVQADFSSETGIQAFIAAIRELTPTLRAIVHNAGDWAPDGDGEGSSGRVFFNSLAYARFIVLLSLSAGIPRVSHTLIITNPHPPKSQGVYRRTL